MQDPFFDSMDDAADVNYSFNYHSIMTWWQERKCREINNENLSLSTQHENDQGIQT